MKNRIYFSLFAVAVSSAAVVTVEAFGRDGHGINPNARLYSENMISEMEQPVAEKADFMKYRLGGNPSTYAPSKYENDLRRAAVNFDELADRLSKFRQEDPENFNKFFGTEDEVEKPVSELNTMENTEEEKE